MLTDPKNLVSPEQLRELNNKFEDALLKLCCLPQNGGNPFLYSFVAPRNNEIRLIPTCATDGNKIYWGLEYIKKLSSSEICIEMMHEALHISLAHCHLSNDINNTITNSIAANLAKDVVVDCTIEKTFKDAGYTKPFWTHLTPCNLDEVISGKVENFCIPDMNWLNNSFVEIYKYIDKKIPTMKYKIYFNNIEDAEGNCNNDGRDIHLKIKLTKEEISIEVKKAIQFANASGQTNAIGSLPGELQEMLESIDNPKLSLNDELRNISFRKHLEAGLRRDHSRYRKRWLSQEIYFAKSHSYKSRILILLDTSGSMSIKDMTKCVGEIQSIFGEAVLVPADSKIYWDKAQNISNTRNIYELNKIECHGRGGTDFKNFFTDFPKYVGIDFDVIVAMTDGHVDMDISGPPIPVFWILPDINNEFKPTFGKVFIISNSDTI